MKKIAILCLGMMCTLAVQAQVKIGYTNGEALLYMMPDYKGVDEQLRVSQRKYQENINIKQQYLQAKLEEYRDNESKGALTAEQKEKMQNDLMTLQKEIEEYIDDAEQQMQARRAELLKPLVTKMQAALEGLAKEEGYSYIFNSAVAGGSVLLHGPKEHDVTLKMLKRLGVEVTPELEKQLKGEEVSPIGTGTGK
ncbi:MAG: OmpH family outer membrane protein [Bacteroidetes bacterium]|nr:OmpH family outer membrane protein [Bacteroidota bacterium]